MLCALCADASRGLNTFLAGQGKRAVLVVIELWEAPLCVQTADSDLWLVVEDSQDDFAFFARACACLSCPPELKRVPDGADAQLYLESVRGTAWYS
jgi:hypothetical protein